MPTIQNWAALRMRSNNQTPVQVACHCNSTSLPPMPCTTTATYLRSHRQQGCMLCFSIERGVSARTFMFHLLNKASCQGMLASKLEIPPSGARQHEPCDYNGRKNTVTQTVKVRTEAVPCLQYTETAAKVDWRKLARLCVAPACS